MFLVFSHHYPLHFIIYYSTRFLFLLFLLLLLYFLAFHLILLTFLHLVFLLFFLLPCYLSHYIFFILVYLVSDHDLNRSPFQLHSSIFFPLFNIRLPSLHLFSLVHSLSHISSFIFVTFFVSFCLPFLILNYLLGFFIVFYCFSSSPSIFLFLFVSFTLYHYFSSSFHLLNIISFVLNPSFPHLLFPSPTFNSCLTLSYFRLSPPL